MTPPAHPAQRIARRYLHEWLAQVRDAASLYVEGFATLESAERVDSTHAAGAQALLIQEDPALVAQLRGSLKAEGGAEVIEAPFTEAAGLVAERAAAVPNVLLCLNPPAPGHLSLDAIGAFAAIPAVDLWIRFPHEDLHKLARFRSTPVADLPPHVRRIAEGYGRLLGEPRGGWLAEWRQLEGEQGSRVAAEGMAKRFSRSLAAAAKGRVLKTMELELPDAGPLHLSCLASDPRRLLALNAAVEELEIDDFVCWPGERFRREPPPPLAEALELFAVEAAPATIRRQLDEVALAEVIAARFRGQRVSWGEVLLSLLDSDVLPDDPVRALRVLRRSGRAVYRSLRDVSVEVSFPEEPIQPSRNVKSAAASGTLGLA